MTINYIDNHMHKKVPIDTYSHVYTIDGRTHAKMNIISSHNTVEEVFLDTGDIVCVDGQHYLCVNRRVSITPQTTSFVSITPSSIQ